MPGELDPFQDQEVSEEEQRELAVIDALAGFILNGQPVEVSLFEGYMRSAQPDYIAAQAFDRVSSALGENETLPEDATARWSKLWAHSRRERRLLLPNEDMPMQPPGSNSAGIALAQLIDYRGVVRGPLRIPRR